jgi:hypothetical protein
MYGLKLITRYKRKKYHNLGFKPGELARLTRRILVSVKIVGLKGLSARREKFIMRMSNTNSWPTCMYATILWSIRL